MIRRLPAAALSVLLAIAAAAAAQPSPPSPSQPLPTDAALPPALERVLRDYEQAWNAGDAQALSALFAEDGFVLQSHRPPVRGRAAIASAYAGLKPGDALRLRAIAHGVSGDIAHVLGAYGFGSAGQDVGKFTLTLRRAGDGRWLIFSDMDNLDAAPKARTAP